MRTVYNRHLWRIPVAIIFFLFLLLKGILLMIKTALRIITLSLTVPAVFFSDDTMEWWLDKLFTTFGLHAKIKK